MFLFGQRRRQPREVQVNAAEQRARFGERAVLDGFPADQVGTLEAAPPRPAWAFDPDDLPTPLPVAP